MLIHPQFDPIAIHLGPLAIRWYGLMYLVGFVGALLLGRARLSQPQVKAQGWKSGDLDDLLFFLVLGVVIGGRLGYVLFYKPGFYFAHPLDILKVWEGGMSFHGGFLGVVAAVLIFAYKRARPWLQITDFIAPLVPFGLATGRLGNFINGELWGRVTSPDRPWAMLFPQAAEDDAAWYVTHPAEVASRGLATVYQHYHLLPRHPSELYEMALEGVLLFVVLWIYGRKPRPVGAASALFLIGYGCCRFIIEFARQPDDFLGLLALGLSMGQWLSLPMIVVGVGVLIWAYRRQRNAAPREGQVV
ncbi:MAG: prolipoprotein diacylglyceryl transferase [Janthinobacterium lividum]